jgi:hypothetical protein
MGCSNAYVVALDSHIFSRVHATAQLVSAERNGSLPIPNGEESMFFDAVDVRWPASFLFQKVGCESEKAQYRGVTELHGQGNPPPNHGIPRMKTSVLALTVCMLASVTAQAKWVGGYASYWDVKDFGDTYGGGFVLQWPVHEFFAVEGRGVWYRDIKDPGNEQIEPATLGIGPALTVDLNERVTGYGSVVGTAFMYARDFLVDGEEVVDDDGVGFGVTLTGGLRVDIQSNWSLLAEASYNIGTIDTKAVRDGQIVDDEIDLDGLAVNVGIGYSW